MKEVLFNRLCIMVTKQHFFFYITIKMTDKEKYVKQPLMYDTVRHSLWVMLMVHSPLTPVPTAGISVIECRLWGLGVKFKWVTQSSEFNFHFKQAPRRCLTHIYSYQPQHRTNICWLIPVVLTVFLGKDGDISVMLPYTSSASAFKRWMTFATGNIHRERWFQTHQLHTSTKGPLFLVSTNWRSNSNFSVEKTNVSTCHYCPFK